MPSRKMPACGRSASRSPLGADGALAVVPTSNAAAATAPTAYLSPVIAPLPVSVLSGLRARAGSGSTGRAPGDPGRRLSLALPDARQRQESSFAGHEVPGELDRRR